MPVCAVKLCRNYKGKVSLQTKVTFHLFPRDQTRASLWINAVRKSRRDDNWNPSKSSIICSEHFHPNDIFVTEYGRRKLRKDAVPKRALYLSSIESDERSNSDSEAEWDVPTEFISMGNIQDESASPVPEQANDEADMLSNYEKISANTKDHSILTFTNAYDDDLGNIEESPLVHTADEENIESNEIEKIQSSCDNKMNTKKDLMINSDDEDFSDLDSVFDSPREARIRKELRRKMALQVKHSRLIRSLRQKNVRLQKRNSDLKEIIRVLKKQIIRQQS